MSSKVHAIEDEIQLLQDEIMQLQDLENKLIQVLERKKGES